MRTLLGIALIVAIVVGVMYAGGMLNQSTEESLEETGDQVNEAVESAADTVEEAVDSEGRNLQQSSEEENAGDGAGGESNVNESDTPEQ